MTIILEIYAETGDPFTYQERFPDDSPDTLIQSAVRDAVNRFLVERSLVGGTIMDPVGKVEE